MAKLVAAHIDSVEKLEVLLLLRGESDSRWTPDQVSRELRRNAASASRCLAQLAKGGLLEQPDRGFYRFAPADPAVARQVGRLAETYATRRVAVVQLIVSNPMDSVTTFADAFRFRRKD